MTPDIALVLGLVLAALSIPSMMSALVDRRSPRASAVTILIAGGLILYAVQTNPGGYTLQDIPKAISRVIGALT